MSSTRWISLDVLRGMAILGTLATNIWIFTNVEGLVGYLTFRHQAADGGWWWAQRMLEQLAQGKFLGLLSIMFGIGVAIQQRSAVARDLRWPGTYPWRVLLLFIDGVVNYVLFTEFDVLTGYAVTGLIVAYLLTMRVSRQWFAVGLAAVIHLLMLATIVTALAASPQMVAGSSEVLSPNPYADGSFVELAIFRLTHLAVFRAETILIIPLTVVLFGVGAMLLRAGILEPSAWRLRRRLMIVGFGVALPLDLSLGIFGGATGLIVARYGTAPFVSLGILAAVAGFYADGRPLGGVGRLLTPIGKTALSCYVLQNAIAGAICYGWGFGLAARLTPSTVVPATVALFVAISVVLMCASRWWLRRFDRGPLELISHRAYRRLSTRTMRSAQPVGSGP